MKLGDMLYLRNTWGRKELKSIFPAAPMLSKGVCNVDETGEQFIEHLLTTKQPFICLQDALRALLSLHTTVSPTFNLPTLRKHFVTILETYGGELEDIPNERQYLIDILSDIECEFTGTVGRNKLRSAIIKRTLNLFVAE